MRMFEDIEILQAAAVDAAPVCRRAIDIAGQIARRLGAQVITSDAFSLSDDFYGRGKIQADTDPVEWLSKAENRYVLRATTDATDQKFQFRSVELQLPPLASEATLFAESGLADLLGDPDREPLIPNGDFAAGTIAYSVICALAALVAGEKRQTSSDVAVVTGADVLAWVNWKTALVAALGSELKRQGSGAEWPVMRCKDGFFALVYQERDWKGLCDMVGDERLQDERFASFKGRQKNRHEYMSIIEAWSSKKTKQELIKLFLQYEIPAAPVMNAGDLLQDELLIHREAFESVPRLGQLAKTPCLPHRVVSATRLTKRADAHGDALPLSGVRVLDLGIITAGAGVSALLADMGAEVLKIESHTYPDPFRQWAGEAESPFFKGNNRNKYGVAIDLKTESGKTTFLDLVKEADVIVENFRRGVLDRLGLTYEVLKSANPNILLCSVSGQGLSGPGSAASSFGSTLEASSGFATCVTYENKVPHITGRNVNFPDQIVVLYAAAMITAAIACGRQGMQLDVSQRDVALFLSGEMIEALSLDHDASHRDMNMVCLTADGDWLALTSDDADCRKWIGKQTTAEAVARLAEKGIGAAVVKKGSEMLHELQARNGEAFHKSPGGHLVKGFPFQFTRQPMSIHLDSPGVGEHSERFISG